VLAGCGAQIGAELGAEFGRMSRVTKPAQPKRNTVWDVSTLRLTIDAGSTTAPFEQVRTQIASAVASGSLGAGTKLATVRQLAADLGLATNTVARAYRELEADGVITTHGRRGTFVSSAVLDQAAAHTGSADIASAAATDYVRTLRRLGYNAQEAARLVEITWNQG
jgi:DNA-binding transcriptional regulator YhcF (GntR family)